MTFLSIRKKIFIVGVIFSLVELTPSCTSKLNHAGVYRNTTNSNEYLLLYQSNKIVHLIKSDTGFSKIHISTFSINKSRLSVNDWKSYNFQFEITNYPNGVSANAEIRNGKISFLWAIDNPIDDFVKTSEKLPNLDKIIELSKRN